MSLERVGKALSKDQPAATARITDGAISPDGEWVVLRTRAALIFYRASQFLNGEFKEAGRVDLGIGHRPRACAWPPGMHSRRRRVPV